MTLFSNCINPFPRNLNVRHYEIATVLLIVNVCIYNNNANVQHTSIPYSAKNHLFILVSNVIICQNLKWRVVQIFNCETSPKKCTCTV